MKCDCYHEYDVMNGECWGTRERELCSCGGDTEYCNYYPDKRKMKDNTPTMTRAEAEKKLKIKIVD